MIAIESFKAFKFKDYIAIILFALLWYLFSSFIDLKSGPQSAYITSLLLTTFLMAFIVHLIRKAGTATLFYIIGSVFTISIGDLGATGATKVWIMGFAGLIFELFFLIFKLEIKNVQIDVILATAVSSAAIPILTAVFLSINVALNMVSNIINLTLLSFFVGLAGAILSFLAWHHLKTHKLILKYEYTP